MRRSTPAKYVTGQEPIEPTEPAQVKRTLAPGWYGFALRCGFDPRTADALWAWRGRMLPLSVHASRQALVDEFKEIRDGYLAAFPRKNK